MGQLRYSRSHFENIESGTFEVCHATLFSEYGGTRLARGLSRELSFLSTPSTVVVLDADLSQSLHAEVFAQESMLTSGIAFSTIGAVVSVSFCQCSLNMLLAREVLFVNFSEVLTSVTSLLEFTPCATPTDARLLVDGDALEYL